MTAAKRKMEMRLEYSFMSLHQFMESNFFLKTLHIIKISSMLNQLMT